MAQCTDCIHYEACLKFADLRVILCGDKADTKCITFKPTADVAPRAEVEKLQEVNADLNESLRLASESNKDLQAKVDRWRFGLEAVLEERAEDRAELAREIFEEMDRILLPLLHEVFQVYIYAKLKKKYTETEPPKTER